MGKLWRVKYVLPSSLGALILVGLLLILSGLPDRIMPLSVAQVSSNQAVGELQGPFTIGQTFYSPYPGLYRVDIMLATYNRSNTGRITFGLTSGSKEGAKIISLEVDASVVADNQLQSFEFPPLGDSTGKTYFFYLEAPAAQPGNAITAWSHSANPYAEGMAYLGGQPVENDLAFMAHFRPSPWEMFDVVLSRIVRGKPGILGNKAFYAVTFVAYLGLTGGVLALLTRRAIGQGR